jgi:hypothetical protein
MDGQLKDDEYDVIEPSMIEENGMGDNNGVVPEASPLSKSITEVSKNTRRRSTALLPAVVFSESEGEEEDSSECEVSTAEEVVAEESDLDEEEQENGEESLMDEERDGLIGESPLESEEDAENDDSVIDGDGSYIQPDGDNSAVVTDDSYVPPENDESVMDGDNSAAVTDDSYVPPADESVYLSVSTDDTEGSRGEPRGRKMNGVDSKRKQKVDSSVMEESVEVSDDVSEDDDSMIQVTASTKKTYNRIRLVSDSD